MMEDQPKGLWLTPESQKPMDKAKLMVKEKEEMWVVRW